MATSLRARDFPGSLFLWLAFIVAAGLRFYKLGDQSLWLDEIYSIDRAREILDHGLETHVLEGHGPLFFYILAPILSLASSEFMLRLPSAVFGVAMVLGSYVLAKELFSPRLGILAALAVAISPYAIWYSQEVRYVSLFMFLSSISILYAYRVTEGGGWRDLAIFVSATLLMVFSFVAGVFLLVGLNLWTAFFRPKRAALRRWILAQAIVVAVFLFWFVHAYGVDVNPFADSAAQDAQPEDFSLETLAAGHSRATQPIQLGYGLFVFAVGYSLGPSTEELHEHPGLRTVMRRAHHVLPVILVVGAIALAGLAGSFKRSKRKAALLVLCFLCPVLGTYALAVVSNIPYNVRYTSGAFVPAAVIFAAGLTWLQERSRWGWLVAAGALALVCVSLLNYYGSPDYAREDSRGAAELVQKLRRPGEPVLVGTTVDPFQFYYPGAFYHWRETELVRSPAQSAARDGSDVKRIWVVATRTWQNPGFKEFLRGMQRCYPIERRFDLAGYELIAYRSRAAGKPASCTLRKVERGEA